MMYIRVVTTVLIKSRSANRSHILRLGNADSSLCRGSYRREWRYRRYARCVNRRHGRLGNNLSRHRVGLGIISCGESRYNDNNLQLILEFWFDARTPDNVGISHTAILVLLARELLHTVYRRIYLLDGQHTLSSYGEVDKHILRTHNRRTSKERRRERRLNNLYRTVIARSRGDAHHGATATRHNLLNIREIDTYQIALCHHNLGNTLGSQCQHIVRLAEGLLDRQRAVELNNRLIAQHNQRINPLAHSLQTCLCLRHTLRALIHRRHRNDSHRKDSHLVCQLRNDRRCSRTCTATHSCGNEEHLRIVCLQILTNLLNRSLGLAFTLLGLVTCTQAISQAYLLVFRKRALAQSLNVRIANH